MNLKCLFVLLFALAAPLLVWAEETDLAMTADLLAQRAMIVDTHIDAPYRLFKDWADVTQGTGDGDFDYERARSGGLNIPFMSIYTPAESEEDGDSYALANRLIDSVEALAKNGGVIQINFGSGFLNQEAREWRDTMDELRTVYLEANGLDKHDDEADQFEKDYRREHPYPYATLDDLVANFEHVISLVGAEHVGIGSDFEGVGDSLPEGMKDVSCYPALIEALLKREYSVDVIQAIMGGNLMRVWREVEDHAKTRAERNAG